MEIVKDNFEESIPLFEESVKGCDFYSLDLEFSGTNELKKFSQNLI